ncbi:MAG TPA: orotate phosphoribosyltransferase [Gammaproteobacteria bacterium]|nr:orotate phosphoribosyltransferase [Gammaproteobacteria bacterium]
MQPYKQQFIEFILSIGVLRFGEYKLKSGRLSPYFFNSGRVNTGAALAKLGHYYAQALISSGIEFNGLFGPAYKGIPIVTATAIALAHQNEMDVPYSFNRKEAKQHAEGGVIVGAPLAGHLMILDDVISAGSSIVESVQQIESAEAQAAGAVIALDRQERGQGEQSAVQELEQRLGLPIISIITLSDLLEYLRLTPGLEPHLEKMYRYRQTYGVQA